ncbi:VIR protein [Plasmodium vivax]|uniref:VIR protein n=1 Tax=Plasmodium vivax TaxID=5855 RepID=A0A1G4H2M1_PLAVI|nr:VIR protein [Plasmodium vivax]
MDHVLIYKATVFSIFPTLNDYKYLSYWILHEFNTNKVKFSNISENFYNNNKKTYNNFFSMESLKSAVEIIQPMNFEYMNILDNLYKNYSEYYTIISHVTQDVEESCNKYTQGCHDSYELGVQKCSDKSSELYEALQSFKASYEDSFKLSGIEYICDSIELKELRSYDEIKGKKTTGFNTENDKNNMFTPNLLPIIVLLSIFIFFYKFTPLGSCLRAKRIRLFKMSKNKDEKAHPILLQTSNAKGIGLDIDKYNIAYISS